MFKIFLENILSGNIKYNEVEDYIESINDIEKDLNNLKKSEKIDKLKGKGYVNLPIALSKIYTNNSSKELINNIKQLINDLYDNKQITKKVYNNLIKTITYK